MASRFASMWRRWLARDARPGRPAAAHRFRPCLELLEERRLLSTYIWTGAGANSNWSTAANWAGGQAPTPGSNASLVFGANAKNFNPVDDLAPGSFFKSVSFTGNHNYAIIGQYNSGVNSLSVSVISDSMAANTFSGFEGSVSLTLAARQPTTVQVNAGAAFYIFGNIGDSGSGKWGTGELVKTGAGAFDFYGNDTSNGSVLINQGTAYSTTNFGSGTIYVAPQANFAFDGLTETQNLQLGGMLVSVGSSHWSGSIVLTSASAYFEAYSTETLAVDGRISGSFTLNQVSGPGAGSGGDVVLTNPQNSFTGANVQGGTLTLESSTALGRLSTAAKPITTTVANGATLALKGGINVNTRLNLQKGATVESVSGFNSLVAAGSVAITGGVNFKVDADQLTVASVIAGAGGLSATGPGNLILAPVAASTFTGPIDVQQGTLTVVTAGALGAAANTATVEDGATLALAPTTATLIVNQNIVVNGAGVDPAEAALWAEKNQTTVTGTVTSNNFSYIGGSTFALSPAMLVLDQLAGQGLFKVGVGTLVLPNNNLGYQGSTTVLSGTLDVSAANSLGQSGTDDTFVDSGAVLAVTNPVSGKATNSVSVGASLSLAGGAVLELDNKTDWTGPVSLGGTASVGVLSGAATIAGDISGVDGAGLSVQGNLTVSGFNTFNGDTTVSRGVLTPVGDQSSSRATLGFSAGIALNPNAVVGGIVATSGANVTSYGGTSAGSVYIEQGATFIASLTAPAATTPPLLTVQTGTITLGGTLNVTVASSAALKTGNVITLIKNQTGSAVSGTFANAADGSTFRVGTTTFKISYEGGSLGNDVTLTVQ